MLSPFLNQILNIENLLSNGQFKFIVKFKVFRYKHFCSLFKDMVSKSKTWLDFWRKEHDFKRDFKHK